MGTSVINVPGGIAFSGFYYPEIFRELKSFLRINRERLGLTDENDFEVHIQLLKAFALVGHLNNTRLDSVATELLIDSAQLLESVKRVLRLVGIELSSASPAVADLVLKLSEVTTLDQTEFVPALAEFATDSTPPIIYEASEDGVDLDRMDQVKYVFATELQDSGSAAQVFSSSPDTFRRTVGSWATDIVGYQLLIKGSSFGNGGYYRVTQRSSSTDIRVVAVPNSESPGFTSETGLSWELRSYSDNYATEANTDLSLFTPWTTLNLGDSLYVAHAQVMPTQLDLVFDTVAAGITGVWEYFDNERSLFNPVDVDLTTSPGQIIFDLTSLLGSTNASGAEVTVTYSKTGATETLTSTWSGTKNEALTAGLLGQVSASDTVTDYLVTSTWVPFDQLVDDTVNLTVDNKVEWELPQTTDRSWIKSDVVNLFEGHWCRYRATVLSGVTIPVIDRIQIDQGDAYLAISVTQGETIGPIVIGSSNGSINQSFNLPDTPFLDNTETVEVDEGGAGNWVEYEQVSNFLNSVSSSRHYKIETDSGGQATITFGDGTSGKVPPAGSDNIRATYRVGGDEDGNVGALQITNNSEGISGISEVYNPRAAVNWRIKDGGDANDLARVKRDKPAELRTRETASNAEDCAKLAVDWVASDGTKPVARAFSYEEGFGVKTIKLMVVGAGGTTLAETYRSELEEWFNGDRYVRPIVYGKAPMNHQVYVVNFEPADISVTATVTWGGGNAESIRNALLGFLTPLAVNTTDQSTYLWDFNGQVSYSKVHSLIHNVDPGITDIPVLQINGAVQSYNLGANELPTSITNNISITINES